MLKIKNRPLNPQSCILYSRKGLTLVELLIFAAIFSILMVTFTSILVTITGIQSRQTSVAEVNQQSQFLLQQIEQLTERSSLIELPENSATTTLKLRMPLSSEDPTYITLANGIVYLQQGTGAQDPLSSSRVSVSSLNFTKHSNPPGHDSVAVSFVISYNTPNIKQQFSETLNAAIARVSAATFDSNVVPSSTATFDLGVTSNIWRSVNNVIYFGGGNVGIGSGASSPTSQLDLAGAQTFRAMSPPAISSAGQAVLYFDSVANQLKLSQNAGAYVNLGTGPWIASGTAIYYNTGNVGIGTTNPVAQLEIKNGTDMLQLSGSGGGWTTINSQTSNLFIKTGGTTRVSVSAGSVGFANDLTVDGKVGVGTPAPSAKLEIAGGYLTTGGPRNVNLKISSGGASPDSAQIYWGDNSGWKLHFGTFDAGNNFQPRMTIVDTGNVGIGTTGPGRLLTVGSVATADGFIFRLDDANGTCDHNPGSGSEVVSCSSDARLKTDIREAAPVLNYLNGLPIRDYTVIAGNQETTGVVAQEIVDKYPELVHLGEDGYYKVEGINPWKIIKGIQEQQKEINDLKAKVKQLEAK